LNVRKLEFLVYTFASNIYKELIIIIIIIIIMIMIIIIIINK